MSNENMLFKEYEERNTYIRSQFDTLVKWFLFFLPIMLGSVGWIFKISLNTQDPGKFMISNPTPVVGIAVFFCLQALIGSVACYIVKLDIRKSIMRLTRITGALAGSEISSSDMPKNPVPE